MQSQLQIWMVDVGIEDVQKLVEESDFCLGRAREVSGQFVSLLTTSRSCRSILLADQDCSLSVVGPQRNVCGEDIEGCQLRNVVNRSNLLLDRRT